MKHTTKFKYVKNGKYVGIWKKMTVNYLKELSQDSKRVA